MWASRFRTFPLFPGASQRGMEINILWAKPNVLFVQCGKCFV